jgi:hypothetical protein
MKIHNMSESACISSLETNQIVIQRKAQTINIAYVIVVTICLHNNYVLCKLSAMNIGLRQTLFEALFAFCRQLVVA